jgi:hypothetical protein
METYPLTLVELEVLAMILTGQHKILKDLRTQLKAARVMGREFTGIGFYTRLWVPNDLKPAIVPRDRIVLDDVEATFGEKSAGFVLFVVDGRLHTLEGYMSEGGWPDERSSFTLRYWRARDFENLGIG